MAKQAAKKVRKKAAGERISKRRVKKPVDGPGEKPAHALVGVVVSQCEGDVSQNMDVKGLVKRTRANPLVGMVEVHGYPCTKPDLAKIGARLVKRGISRVVVAGPSERLYGRFYRDILARFGIEPSLVGFANIREHCALVHPNSRSQVGECAARLIDVAVARVAGATPKERIEAEIRPTCAVIGAGIAGISAAAALASRGVGVVLLDREAKVGGLLNRLNIVYPSYIPAGEFLDRQAQFLKEGSIDVRAGIEPVSVRGHVGDFRIGLSDGSTLEAGTIIVATGADLLVPEGLFGYGERDDVFTQVEFEAIMKSGDNPGADVVMIQCAGSRNDQRPYCSRICCTASIKNAILIKQKSPMSRVTILSRGFAGYAGDLDRARDMGVEIIRYSLERPPVVGDGTIEVYDQISEMEARIPFTRVVLAVPMVPRSSNANLAKMLKMPMDEYGFLIEPHLKLRPEEYAPRGVFVAGCAHWPSTITEAIVQGYGAASRAYDLISAGRVERYAHVTKVDAEYCRGCGRCEEACQHGAIELTVAEDGLKQAQIMAIQCTGCGVCVSVCPSGALSLGDLSYDEIGMTAAAIMEA